MLLRAVVLVSFLTGCVTAPSKPRVDAPPEPEAATAPVEPMPPAEPKPPPTHSAVVPVSRLEEPAWRARYDEIRRDATAAPGADIVLLGDSLLHGFRSHPDLLARLGARTLNAGVIGDGTQHLLWRLRSGQLDGLSPRLAVILIGANNGLNTAQEIADGIEANVREARGRFPRAKVLVLGILPSGRDPASARRARNTAANELVRSFTDGRRVAYVDVGFRFVAKDGAVTDALREDALHISRKGYEILADSLAALVRAMLPPE